MCTVRKRFSLDERPRKEVIASWLDLESLAKRLRLKPKLCFNGKNGSRAQFKVEGEQEDILAFESELMKTPHIRIEDSQEEVDGTICRFEKPPPTQVAFSL